MNSLWFTFIHPRMFIILFRCSYCKQFNPVFDSVVKKSPYEGIKFGKLDGQAHKDAAEKYKIFSYPTLAFFWKGIDMPIFYRK